MAQPLQSVMVVDDDHARHFFYRKIIQQANSRVEVTGFADAAEALTFLGAVRRLPHRLPDLVLLDLHMPVTSGWQFLHHLQSLRGQFDKDPVVIVLSASVNPADEARTQQMAGVAAFFHLPFSADLWSAIRQVYHQVRHPASPA